MNRVAVNAEEVPLPPWTAELARYAEKALCCLGRDNWDLSVFLCGNRYIRSLNAQSRDRDEPTDVLSFALGTAVDDPQGQRYLPGDIVISLETLRENARYFQVSQDEELRRLLIHGILHLDGMDHLTNAETEPMLRLQEELLLRLAPGEIIPVETV
jgi:probable rRNA maturation factor